MSLTCGAKGTRTPGLLHAISRHPVPRRPSPQVTVPDCLPGSARVRMGCGTFLRYGIGPRQEADNRVHAARRFAWYQQESNRRVSSALVSRKLGREGLRSGGRQAGRGLFCG